MKKRRRFTPEFKAQLVLEVLTGSQSPAEVCRKHALSPNLLATWKATVLQGLPSLFQGDGQRDEDQARIAEPCRCVSLRTSRFIMHLSDPRGALQCP